MIPKREGEMPKGRRIALIVMGGASGVALAAGLVWLAFAAKPLAEAPRQDRIEPAQETTESPLPSAVSTQPATSTVETTSTGTGGAAGGLPNVVRAARIAYRLGGTLYVANEDGSQPSPVARIAEGSYVLSPDGLTLAAVTEGRLKMIDTASGAAVDAGEALDTRPVWMPDSTAAMFLRRKGHADEVRRVTRSGENDTLVRQGSSVSVSPGGRVIAVTPSGAVFSDGYVWVSVGGAPFSRVTVGKGLPTAVAAGDDRLYAGLQGTPAGGVRLVSVRLDGRDSKQLAEQPGGDVPAVWGELCMSPDGAHLGAVALGDDEYSRISIFALPGGPETRLNPRRDAYARCWSSAGDFLYYVEGNAYQGEPTVLYRVAPNGTGRRVVATGAE